MSLRRNSSASTPQPRPQNPHAPRAAGLCNCLRESEIRARFPFQGWRRARPHVASVRLTEVRFDAVATGVECAMDGTLACPARPDPGTCAAELAFATLAGARPRSSQPPSASKPDGVPTHGRSRLLHLPTHQEGQPLPGLRGRPDLRVPFGPCPESARVATGQERRLSTRCPLPRRETAGSSARVVPGAGFRGCSGSRPTVLGCATTRATGRCRHRRRTTPAGPQGCGICRSRGNGRPFPPDLGKPASRFPTATAAPTTTGSRVGPKWPTKSTPERYRCAGAPAGIR